MDSLRVRDYLYPSALPSDEMKASGGGKQFKDFLVNELLPKIDSEFRTEKENRSLLGHSFGGYFVLYSLLDQLESNSNDFKTFISASPSLWYNDFYLNRISDKLGARPKADVNIFMSVGGMEDSTWAVKPFRDLTNEIQKRKSKEIEFKSQLYNHLDHMDVGYCHSQRDFKRFLIMQKNKIFYDHVRV